MDNSLYFNNGSPSLNDESDQKRKRAMKYITVGCLLGLTSYMLSSGSEETQTQSLFSKPVVEDDTTQLISADNMCRKGLGFWESWDRNDVTWSNISSSGKFQDSEFPANTSSLWVDGFTKSSTPGLGQKFKSVNVWKRPSELLHLNGSNLMLAEKYLPAEFENEDFEEEVTDLQNWQSFQRGGNGGFVMDPSNGGFNTNPNGFEFNRDGWNYPGNRVVRRQTTSGDESCNRSDCSDYSGRQNKTKSGKTCQNWSSKGYRGSKTPGNYCRNPDSDGGGIWCFVSPYNMTYEYCERLGTIDPPSTPALPVRPADPEPPRPPANVDRNIEKCERNDCSDYRGKQNKTTDGKSCVSWSSKGWSTSRYPTVEANYCRNPDGDRNMWCFTSQSSKAYGYCEPLVHRTPSTDVVEHHTDGANTPSLWGRQGVKPAGVRQGELGDCWFLSTASALAEHPDRIKKMFRNSDYPENGAFMLFFYSMGRHKNVIIDDRLPMNPRFRSSYQPVASNVSVNGAWWLPIMEKAYAKFNVFYANMDGGTPLQAIQDLTNMPAIRYESAKQNNDDLHDSIMEADQKHWIMIGACQRSYQGLTAGHAYTILGAYELTDQNGKQWNLIKMRNPWSKEAYNGPWNDKDDRWTDSIRRQVGHTHEDDGVFLLPVETFRVAYTYYYIGMYQEWNMSTWTNNGQAKVNKKSFTSNVDQDAVVVLRWIAERRYPLAGCSGRTENTKQSYNLFVTINGRRQQLPAFKDIGMITHRFQGGLKAGQTIELMVYDFNFGQTNNQDFMVTVYAEKQGVNMF